MTVTGNLFLGISAANGNAVVSGGTSRLTAFTYNQQTGSLSPGQTADFGKGQPDVYQPSGDIAFVSTDFPSKVDGRRFGITVASLPSLQIQNQIGLLSGNIPSQALPFGARSANFPVVSTSFQAGGSLCLAGATPDGFTVVCNPGNAQQSLRFDVAGTSNALGVAAGGSRSFVVTLNGNSLSLLTFDVSGLPTSGPVLVSSEQLATGVSPPVAVAASPDGSRVVVAANQNGLFVSSR
jgi:hypothetical protein